MIGSLTHFGWFCEVHKVWWNTCHTLGNYRHTLGISAELPKVSWFTRSTRTQNRGVFFSVQIRSARTLNSFWRSSLRLGFSLGDLAKLPQSVAINTQSVAYTEQMCTNHHKVISVL